MKLPIIQKELILQWHITEKCDFRCKFCYISNLRKEQRRDFPLEKGFEVIDDFSKFTKSMGLIGRINFTGGNPLLHPYFFDLAKYARKKHLRFGILGNPTAGEDTLKELKRLKIFRYQISIDGLETTHDFFRGKGRFKQALKFLELEGEVGIVRVVLSTVSKKNYKEIPSLIRLLYTKKLTEIYDFARLVPIGEGKFFIKDSLSPSEFKELLYNVFNVYLELSENGAPIHIGTKEPLWMLLYENLGILAPEIFHLRKIRGGCSVGWAGIILDVNGDVYPCRRMSIKVGNVFEKNLSEIFLFSKKINEFRDIEHYECKNCKLFWICRGCRAIAWSINKNEYSRDPGCWKVVL